MSPAVLADPDNSDFDNMLGMNPVVVMNALSETGSRKMGRLNSGHTDLDRHDEKELIMKNSENVLRKIRSQQTSKLRQYQDADKEVIYLKKMFKKEDTSKGPLLGFIHNSNTLPNELAIWMYLANSLQLHINTKSRVTDVNGTKISYPLADCLTESHSQLGVSRFLENTRLDMKKLGYRNTMPFANIVTCDFSYAMLHGISKGVNDGTLVAYIKRAYKVLNEDENWDSSKSLFKRIREYQMSLKVIVDAVVLITNPNYCPAVPSTLEKDYMSVWPIWSNVIEQRKAYSDFLRTTNSSIEAEFNIRKQVYKTGRGRLYSDYRKQDLNCELANEKWQKRRKPRTPKYFTSKDTLKSTLLTTPLSKDEISLPKTSHPPSEEKLDTEKPLPPSRNAANFKAALNIPHDHKYSSVSDSKTHETSTESSSERLIANSKNWDGHPFDGVRKTKNLFKFPKEALKETMQAEQSSEYRFGLPNVGNTC
ncbi:unnamed protein product [Orchesella dallaii]|uniref:Uncharacterized protein n=1 Tax=Orchesella dallaii TaxID=48710 RepID=A0ABP1RNQ5_9HEXA